MSKRVPATAAEKRHIGIVKTMPCVICYPAWYMTTLLRSAITNFGFNSEYHHITDARGRLGHMFGLPLCANHHRGRDGFSGINRGAWDKSLNNQLALLEKVCKVLGIDPPAYQTKVVPRRQFHENLISN